MNDTQFNSSYASLIKQFLCIKAASYCEKTIITYRRVLKDLTLTWKPTDHIPFPKIPSMDGSKHFMALTARFPTR